MQLIAQDLNQCVFIELADIDNGGAQRPPSCCLCGEPPIELLLGEKAPLYQDIAKLAAIDSEHFFPREAMRRLIPADPLTCPQIFKITQSRPGHSEIVYYIRDEITR